MASSAYYSGCEYDNYEPHFLDCCFLCRRPLSQNNDIFMYRGDTPFCSQDCRQEQIEMDESSEKKLMKLSASKRSNTVRKTTSDSAKEYDNKGVRTAGTVAVA